MEQVMRLKEADCPVAVADSRLQYHNVLQRDRNRNQSLQQETAGERLPVSDIHSNSAQWANNYVSATSQGIVKSSNFNNSNNNISSLRSRSSLSEHSEFLSESSPDDSLGDFEDAPQSASSPQREDAGFSSHGEESLSDSESLSEDGNCVAPGGIVNPNYPGFQHLAHSLLPVDSEEDEDSNNNNNNCCDLGVNHLDSVDNFQKAFYDKPKFNLPADGDKDLNVVVDKMAGLTLATGDKMSDAFLSGAKEDLTLLKMVVATDSNRVKEEEQQQQLVQEEVVVAEQRPVTDNDEEDGNEKFSSEQSEKEEVPRKKEKMEEINYNVKKIPDTVPVRRRETINRVQGNRRSVPAAREKKKASPEIFGGFDVYNIETAMPKIDLDAIESHLRAAREEERRRRNDREEIRRRLAMGSDTDDYYGGERASKKPSLQARLQSGMNLQICFMNETISDIESPGSDTETPSAPAPEKMSVPRSHTLPAKCVQPTPTTRPSTSLLSLPLRVDSEPAQPLSEADFFARQARLQAEARMALAQAKEMAHMQMEVERQRQKKSPITEMVRCSLEKVGIPFPEDRRRVSRQILTEMNVAQLQVIVNDLHTQIEILNEGLVKFLMDRDDLHMEQDSMLVDIEDLTRYLGAKEQSVKEQKDVQLLNQNNNLLSSKPKINRIASLGKK